MSLFACGGEIGAEEESAWASLDEPSVKAELWIIWLTEGAAVALDRACRNGRPIFDILSLIAMTPGTSISSILAASSRSFRSVSSARLRTTDWGSAIHLAQRSWASEALIFSLATRVFCIALSKARI
ncbi:hypothetical protein OPQ81_011320 [Rhizoctonia solani]|nr:hypothetical protein OPQ81_011320 [Rhizoctonia solani]